MSEGKLDYKMGPDPNHGAVKDGSNAKPASEDPEPSWDMAWSDIEGRHGAGVCCMWVLDGGTGCLGHVVRTGKGSS